MHAEEFISVVKYLRNSISFIGLHDIEQKKSEIKLNIRHEICYRNFSGFPFLTFTTSGSMLLLQLRYKLFPYKYTS